LTEATSGFSGLRPDFLRRPRSPRAVAFWLAFWLAVVGNLALWRELYRIGGGTTMLVSAAGAFVIVLAALTALMLLTAWGRWMKPVWIAILVAAGIAQHFMLTYGVVMDTAMLANTMQTNPREAGDLLGWAFVANLLLVVALPTALIVLVPVRRTPWWPQLWRNAVLFAGAVAVTLAASFAMFSRLAPLVRNNMHLRYIVNPIAGFTSAAAVALEPLFRKSKALVPITAGAALGAGYAGLQKPPLVVVVVGETARADHFSLNGYARETNPELAKAGALSFRNVQSCGTDTRDSVPCMLSPLDKAAFEKRGDERENILDLLQAVGLGVLWLDNQSGCKDVCDRVPTQTTADLASADAARLCSGGECRDEALLVGLDERIAKLPEERRNKGVVLFMHQMGSHGPAYYKRSAPEQKRFLPECTNIDLARCDHDQLINAYDNSIIATDHVLAETIAWLKRRSADRATALVYMSDHGESLGELGIFLHGLPYPFAPQAQKHVAYVAWIGPGLAAWRGIDLDCAGRGLDAPLSHDNLYHTVLGLVDVTTPTYDAALDTFAPCRKPRKG
jgi:lipid A ethanolaminephosphotransferase